MEGRRINRKKRIAYQKKRQREEQMRRDEIKNIENAIENPEIEWSKVEEMVKKVAENKSGMSALIKNLERFGFERFGFRFRGAAYKVAMAMVNSDNSKYFNVEQHYKNLDQGLIKLKRLGMIDEIQIKEVLELAGLTKEQREEKSRLRNEINTQTEEIIKLIEDIKEHRKNRWWDESGFEKENQKKDMENVERMFLRGVTGGVEALIENLEKLDEIGMISGIAEAIVNSEHSTAENCKDLESKLSTLESVTRRKYLSERIIKEAIEEKRSEEEQIRREEEEPIRIEREERIRIEGAARKRYENMDIKSLGKAIEDLEIESRKASGEREKDLKKELIMAYEVAKERYENMDIKSLGKAIEDLKIKSRAASKALIMAYDAVCEHPKVNAMTEAIYRAQRKNLIEGRI